ncbi:MltA domain-containing protein [Rhodanobacter sp. OK091]|uniref:MltA domain-containing protein n=1 Tax=Rhodanobacter sp. OK091 TaxID=1881037 RepID=UPI00091D2FF2|nr:MltA domain-containing protein [Rhodanobacter sp. OK091]SHL73265.1 3D domain-containing protein [Rhodanobacter sp. OK091]
MTSRQTSPFPSPALAALGLLLSLAGSLVAQTMPASSNAGVPVVIDGDALGQPFVTKYARFQPVPFSTLPGWNTDALRESLDVFSRSCKVLSRKNAWSASCGDLTGADSGSDDGARRFFEAHFQVYQVMNPDATADGRITGYYEPQLEGRSTRNAQFRFPVYGAPRDLYQLDARSLSGASRQWFRIEDNRLLAAAPGTADAREYELALDNDLPDLADKRYRVRLDGGRIVPYFNRQQIESQGIDAPVLAWVQDAYVLYSMQVQGSGKIKLEDGRLVRVAYAEQNGQPFLPNASSSDTALASSAIKTRGLRLGSASAAGEAANAPTDDVASIIAQLRHGSGSGPAADPAPAASPRAATPASHTSTTPHNSDVQAIIAQLRHGNAAATGSASAAAVQPMPAAASAAAPKAHDPQVQAMIAQLLGKAPPPTAAGSFSSNAQTHVSGSDAARMAVDPHRKGVAKNITASSGSTSGGALSGIGDPSYVFFRVIPDGPQGPLGALGVPLTAGRSLAVDPRTTPLGAPVFVTTAAPGGAGSIDRLMFAQDTGGAIRGSVRGDFFWGFGDDAGSMAASMNANGRMWLLLPKGLTLGALNPKVRTRGLGSSAAAPDCVIPDDESCVEN